MQLNFLNDDYEDLSKRRVLIGLSGGINSAAVLCYILESYPIELRPAALHLFYAHFAEHSPDTFAFVKDLIHYARLRFPGVQVKVTRNSVLRFFEAQGIIPHPTISPCSIELKIKPMYEYAAQNSLDCQLVGYVRHESKRIKRQRAKDKSGFSKYPISHWSDDDCLDFVKSIIGWYPAIYDLKEQGKRVFTHNNCLPCKNMQTVQIEKVRKYYPAFTGRADDTAARIGSYWGRQVSKAIVCDNCERLFA